jgi:hypothetical protein
MRGVHCCPSRKALFTLTFFIFAFFFQKRKKLIPFFNGFAYLVLFFNI